MSRLTPAIGLANYGGKWRETRGNDVTGRARGAIGRRRRRVAAILPRLYFFFFFFATPGVSLCLFLRREGVPREGMHDEKRCSEGWKSFAGRKEECERGGRAELPA